MHPDDPTQGNAPTPSNPAATPSAPRLPQQPSNPPTAHTLAPPTAAGAHGSPGTASSPSTGGGDNPSSSPPVQAWQAPGSWSSPQGVERPATTPVPTVPGATPPGPPTVPPGAMAAAASPAPMGAGAPQGNKGAGGIKAALIGGLVGAIVAGGVTAAAMTIREDSTAPAVAASASIPSRNSNTITADSLDIRALLEKVQPSVVSIHTGTRQGEAAGSGIVLSEDGLVLTNAHVVEGATRIEVDFADGQTVEARLIGSAPEADVALVQASGLDGSAVPAELGSSGDLLVGDDVVAIGNALNLGAEPSVTTGIVSQVGRSISAPDGTVLDDLIQTDAAINPGNSGGPLINSSGQVVGVNTAILADAQNIGFALEIDSIRTLIEDLQAGKDAQKERPVLGVATLDVARIDNDVAERFSVTATSGAFVQDVTSGSGADVAGLQAGDVILEVDGRRVRTSEDVGQAVRAKEAGDSITILIEREGTEQSVDATLGSN